MKVAKIGRISANDIIHAIGDKFKNDIISLRNKEQ